jgi:6-pyruvoyltetrahydropterin/6-carboxytetrahydropterin synthase
MKNWQLCRIGKQYAFSAAHQLPKVGDGHPCKRLHGHNYVVEIEVRGEISPKDGFCSNIDFMEVDKHMKPIIEQLDHHFLNDIPGLENPTAEHIAAWILDKYPVHYLFSVTVWETPKCWAQVVNSDGFFPKEHRD